MGGRGSSSSVKRKGRGGQGSTKGEAGNPRGEEQPSLPRPPQSSTRNK
jgi:hypothetical protein